MDQKIDFVITWVDGSDVEWQKDKAKYSAAGADVRNARYRDWDQLKYWFRAVEKFAPWVNKIHFVTYGHLPKWLNTNNPKLHVVNHEDFIPEKYLPVFNSTAIEVHLHRIPNLSDKFVYFCDDYYLMRPCKSIDFFKKNKPVDMPRLAPVLPANHEMYFYHLYNDYSVYRQFFNKKRMLSLFGKYVNLKYGKIAFSNLSNLISKNLYVFPLHLPQPILKETMAELWERYPREFEETASSRFRQITNNSLEMVRGYYLMTGEFYPKRRKGIVLSSNNPMKANSTIKDCPYKLMCLSDVSSDNDFESDKELINSAFDTVFPEKCSFEK